MTDRTYWHKQTADKPLYPDLIWSRPENRAHAGKLLIAGGNAHGFAAAGEAYTEATAAGIGTARVLLPDSLQKTVGKVFAAGEYAPSTPSGSFGRQAMAELSAMAAWADGVLLAGDFGRNSETAILLESFADHYQGQLTLTQDAADYFTASAASLLQRPDTLLVISFAQLQKIASGVHLARPFTFEMDFLRLIDTLHEFNAAYPGTAIIIKHLDTLFAAAEGQVSTTKLTADLPVWRVRTAARASTWWLQNPAKTFAALTTAAHTVAIKS